MDELWKSLQMREKELKDVIKYAENILKNAPDGFLRIVKNKNTEQYYLRDNSKNSFGIYIKKSNMKLIENLAQKDYAEKLLKQAKLDKDKIQEFMNEYLPNSIKKTYEELAPKRKKLVKPYILPDEEFVNQWIQTAYNKKEILVEAGSEIVTEKGEVVRSKSEKILADKLNLMNIPYHYEKPLFLKGYGTIYPDFTVLNLSTRREGMELTDRVTIMAAIGNHDESTGGAVDAVSAALIIADKTDVRRNRVREKDKASFDIHDRVNYAVTEAKLKINPEKNLIALNLQIDEKICTMYEYFEIFLGRMVMCRRAAEILGAKFKLTANGSKIL